MLVSLRPKHISRFTHPLVKNMNLQFFFSRLLMTEHFWEFFYQPQPQPCDNNASPLNLINGHERLLIEPWGHNAIRVRASLYQDPIGNEVGALLETQWTKCSKEHLKTPLKISYHNDSAIQNGMIEVTISKSMLKFWRKAGSSRELLFEELWPQVTILPILVSGFWILIVLAAW